MMFVKFISVFAAALFVATAISTSSNSSGSGSLPLLPEEVEVVVEPDCTSVAAPGSDSAVVITITWEPPSGKVGAWIILCIMH